MSSEEQLQLLIILLGVGLGVLVFFVALLYYLRAKAHAGQILKSGREAKKTFMITVPKFVSEAELRNDDSTAQVQEFISIAETFYAAIGGLKAQKGFKAWFYGRTDEVALEIVGHEGLVSFYITIPDFMHEFVEQQLHAQYPNAAVTEIEDYNIFSPTGTIVGGYLKLKRELVLPIKTFKLLESDTLNPITNALSKVADGDGVAVQYVIRSAPRGWRSLGTKIVKNMNKGMTFKEAVKGSKGSGGKSWVADEISRQVAGSGPGDPNKPEQQRQMSQAEQQMLQGIENKISKAGMDVNIRIVASSQNAGAAQANLNQIMQAYSQFNIYEFGNAFGTEIPRRKDKLVEDFIFRRFHDKYRMLFNTEEMASLWHLPGKSSETPNIRWMLARTAPAPPGLPTEGLHIGFNPYRGKRTDIYMTDDDRRRHFYIIGKTGSGKSHFVRYMVNQDIKNGKGVCVIDPHGDLADDVMGSIPKDRIDDVIYFNPSDMDRPMGLNMLEAPNESMRDFAVQEMISIFYMLFPPEMIGPMFEHQMRNYMLTLMADVENPGTIVEIPRMISDDDFQKKWVAKVKDPVVRSFWEDEMANTSDYHKSEMTGYLVSKVGRFVENEMMRNIMGQAKSAINFRQVMDEGKILLVNLSKGKTGDVNANLLGLIIVSKLQMAAFARADMAEEDRRDFYLYIDEFQNFITPSIATILSEARKYKLNLIMAHQYMGQLVKDGKTEIRDAVLGNVGNTLVARVGPEDTDVLGKLYEPVFSPYDLQNTDKFTWNARIIANNDQVKPFTLKAIPNKEPNRKLVDALKEISRLTYGRPKDIVEREIALRSGIGMKKAKSAVTPPPPPSK